MGMRERERESEGEKERRRERDHFPKECLRGHVTGRAHPFPYTCACGWVWVWVWVWVCGCVREGYVSTMVCVYVRERERVSK